MISTKEKVLTNTGIKQMYQNDNISNTNITQMCDATATTTTGTMNTTVAATTIDIATCVCDSPLRVCLYLSRSI